MPPRRGRSSSSSSTGLPGRTRTLFGSPPEVGQPVAALVSVRNVNDVLYEYQVDVLSVPRPLDDFANLLSGLGLGAAPPGSPDPCRLDELKEAMASVANELKTNPFFTPARVNNKYTSVPLASTLAEWHQKVGPALLPVRTLVSTIQQNQQCMSRPEVKKFLETDYALFNTLTTDLERRVAGQHRIEVSIMLRPDYDYTVVVTEHYKGETTTDGTKSFTFSPLSTVLTLSAGFMATTLEGRTYTARTAPGAAVTDPTRTVLAIDGTGARPALAALLNYQIPYLDGPVAGVALSTGPVFKFNSGTTNTSSFGYFVGVSIHLWRRLYITPGAHLGEYADTPIGFSGKDAPVPANFGELIPTKRWITKLAVAVTVKTNDLSKVSKPKAAPKDETAKPAPEKKEK